MTFREWATSEDGKKAYESMPGKDGFAEGAWNAGRAALAAAQEKLATPQGEPLGYAVVWSDSSRALFARKDDAEFMRDGFVKDRPGDEPPRLVALWPGKGEV